MDENSWMERISRHSWPWLRWPSVTCFALALVAVAALVVSDAMHLLRPGAIHTRLSSAALILIGLSYLNLQLSLRRAPAEMLKGLLLGIAFVLWGGEQFLPAGRLVTAMDGLVVTIFVVDLTVIIAEHLQRKDHETP